MVGRAIFTVMAKLDTVGAAVVLVLTPSIRIAGIGTGATTTATIATTSTTTIATTTSTTTIAVGVGIGKEGIELVDLGLHLVNTWITLGTVGVNSRGGTVGALVGVNHFRDGILGRLGVLDIIDGTLELGDAFQKKCICRFRIGIRVQGNESLIPICSGVYLRMSAPRILG